MTCSRTIFAALVVIFGLADFTPACSAEPLRLLFLGDRGIHRPADRFKQLQPVLKERGIELTYTDRIADLNAETLGKYAGLVIYANQEKIAPEQEKALLDFVAGGKGLVAAALRVVLFSEFAQVHRTGRGAVPTPRHRHVPHDPGRSATSDHARLRGLRELGRDLRPHQT